MFDKQEAYLEKLYSGDPNKQGKVPQKAPKEQKPVEKKEETEPVRKDDPKIDL